MHARHSMPDVCICMHLYVNIMPHLSNTINSNPRGTFFFVSRLFQTLNPAVLKESCGMMLKTSTLTALSLAILFCVVVRVSLKTFAAQCMFPASPSYVTQRLVASDLGQTTREGGSERLGQGEATRAYILHKIASFKDTGLIFSIHCTGSSRMLTDSASLCSLHHLGCMTDEKSIQRCICFLFPGT